MHLILVQVFLTNNLKLLERFIKKESLHKIKNIGIVLISVQKLKKGQENHLILHQLSMRKIDKDKLHQ